VHHPFQSVCRCRSSARTHTCGHECVSITHARRAKSSRHVAMLPCHKPLPPRLVRQPTPHTTHSSERTQHTNPTRPAQQYPCARSAHARATTHHVAGAAALSPCCRCCGRPEAAPWWGSSCAGRIHQSARQVARRVHARERPELGRRRTPGALQHARDPRAAGRVLGGAPVCRSCVRTSHQLPEVWSICVVGVHGLCL
jgi:hypothetical protein